MHLPWQAAILPYDELFRCLDITKLTNHESSKRKDVIVSVSTDCFQLVHMKKNIKMYQKKNKVILLFIKKNTMYEVCFVCLLRVIAIMKILQYVVEHVSFSGAEENRKNLLFAFF